MSVSTFNCGTLSVEEAPTGPECQSDADCGPNEVCVNGECVLAEQEPECQSDADCGPNEVCMNGECVAVSDGGDGDGDDGEDGLEPPPECVTSADCDANERCVNGECVPVSDGDGDQPPPGDREPGARLPFDLTQRQVLIGAGVGMVGLLGVAALAASEEENNRGRQRRNQ